MKGPSLAPIFSGTSSTGDLTKADKPKSEEEESEEETEETEDKALEEEEEDVGDEETEEEEEGMTTANKSQTPVTEEDFQKSLDRLEAEAAVGNQESRKTELLAKAQGAELEPAERDELFGILGGGDTAAKSLGAEVTGGLQTNEVLQKAYDVSDFLAEHNLELTKSLDSLSQNIEASDTRQHEFNLVLAKAMVDTGKLIKAMSERLGVIASQPARPPKAKGAQPLNKSMIGGSEPPAGEQLNKAQIQDALDALMEKSVTAGDQGMSGKGMDIAVETAKFEMSSKLSPTMFEEVQAHIGSRG